MPSNAHENHSPINSRFTRRTAVVGGTTALALGSLVRAGAQSTPEASPAGARDSNAVSGGTLRVGLEADPAELDPALVVLDAASTVIDLVYEGLVHEGPDLTPQPRIATDWSIADDGLTYTFNLRPGVTFHNGRALVAEDVKYSLERVKADETASPWQSYADSIDTIETPDDSTVIITLAYPDASILSSLGRRGLSIVPREEVENHGDLRQIMIGSGPFRFIEYVPNSRILLERNPEYWDTGLPYVDELDLQIIPDGTARTTAIVSDTVDMIQSVPAKDIVLLEADANLEVVSGPSTNLRWIVFNLRREPFSNLAFRQAIARGIDRQQIIDSAYFGYGTPLYGVYPAGFWAGYPEDPPAPDMEAAQAEIAALDLPDDFMPGILTWGEYDFLEATSVVVQEQLRLMGIESEIEPEENATYLERHFSGNFDIAVMGAGGYIDPHDFLGQTMGTGGVTNAAGYSNPEMDDLLQRAISETDREVRRDLYIQIQELIIRDVPWIPLSSSDARHAARHWVKGYERSASGSMTGLRHTWIDPTVDEQ